MRLLSFAALLNAALVALIPAHAQTVVPVSASLPPPAGLTFDGQWECRSGDLIARLQVTPGRARHDESMTSVSTGWTMLTETQQGMVAHYLVGYDRDAKEFLLLDADDPAHEEFRTEGWSGPIMTLTYVGQPNNPMPANRFVYLVDNSSRFTVSWEEYENGDWKAHDTYVCARSSRKDVRESFRSHCHHRQMH
jgi:hypothetical protein